MSEEFLESLYAKCPDCGTKLSHGHDGSIKCQVCYIKYLGEDPYGKGMERDWEGWSEHVSRVDDADYKTPILVKDWKERISDFALKEEVK
jgi:hypothetical protein